MREDVCVVCSWREETELQAMADLGLSVSQMRSAGSALAGRALCNRHAHQLVHVTSPATLALILDAAASRVAGGEIESEHPCPICTRLHADELACARAEARTAHPRLCRGHLAMLLGQGENPESLVAARENLRRRAGDAVERLRGEAPPDALRVAPRLVFGARGVSWPNEVRCAGHPSRPGDPAAPGRS